MPYFTRFEAAMRGLDEVMECHLVSGGYDYLVKFSLAACPITRR